MMHRPIWEVSKILEILRISEYGLVCQNIPATQFPTFVKSQKIPNEKGRSSEAIIFHGKSGEVNRISSQIALWLPEKYPITFFHRIPQLIHRTFGEEKKLVWKLLLMLISLVLDFTRDNLIKTHLYHQHFWELNKLLAYFRFGKVKGWQRAKNQIM